MPGIGVVLNPKSRRNLRDPGAALRLARRLGDHGVVRPVQSIDELHRTAEDFKRLDIDVLGISGGDGTNHVTITGFLDVYAPDEARHTTEASPLPQIAFLRGGTMNTVANAVGVRRGRPEGLLARLVRAYADRATLPLANVERRVMRIRPRASETESVRVGGRDVGSALETPAHYGFIFGTGVVHGYLAEYYRDGEPSPLVAAKTLLRGIGSALVQGEMIRRMAKPFRGRVTLVAPRASLDRAPSGVETTSEWPERDYLTVVGGTIDQIGLGFRPFYRSSERDGTFHLLGIYASPRELVCNLHRIKRARPLGEGRTYDATPESVVIRSADGIMRYTIDGDLHEHRGPLEISTGPKVRIVVVP